jgi:polysaccharide biosynthesis protein PelA
MRAWSLSWRRRVTALVLCLWCAGINGRGAVATTLGSVSTAAGEERAASINPASINRDVLGLFDGTTEAQPNLTRLHRFLEMPLNHLGFRLRLHDVSKGLPTPEDAGRYRAIVTWFSGRIANADAYLAWAAERAAGGQRLIVIDSAGALGSASELPAINAVLAPLGITQAEYFVGDTKETKIGILDPAMMAGEVALIPAALPAHTVFIANSTKPSIKTSGIKTSGAKTSGTIGSRAGEAVVHLSVTDPAHRWVKAPESALVVTGPGGGFIGPGYAVTFDAASNRSQWLVDPFQFLEAALGVPRMPVPDTTTVSGRRLYFSHIDGDGWNNATEIEPFAARRARAADVVLERLIQPYPDLPVSVGLIGGDVTPDDGGQADGAAVARAMFALPQVEVASHTHTHPFYWRQFERYRRETEQANVLATVARNPAVADRSLTAVLDKWRAAPELASELAAAEVAKDLPRARPHQPFDLTREVQGGLNAATRLAPAAKSARLYLWSGDCRPFEAALRAARVAGVRNLNGGDSRFDADYPSKLYVSPLARMVGAERQIYAVNSNENTYTNGWTGPFDAFKTLTSTLDNTELPRRLKGFNLYYHSFSATKQAGLDAVEQHLQRARVSPLAPIAASHYADIAEGFFSAVITPIAPDRWQVSKRGGLQTVRFDRADGLNVDYPASTGVIGANRHAGALYVTLDSAVGDAVVALAKRARAQSQPHLIDSRWVISQLVRAPCNVRAQAQGFGDGGMTWAGLAPGRYTVVALRNGAIVASERVTVGPDGRLTARLKASGIEPLQLKITCDRAA